MINLYLSYPQVFASNDFLYQVIDNNSQHVVNLKLMTCTCNRFQIDGVPCQHGLAVIGERGEQPYHYCSKYHTRDSYMACYAGFIVLLGEHAQWKLDKYLHCGDILLPRSNRQPRRPRKARRRTRFELINPTKCGRCGSAGHNRRTCKQPKPLSYLGKRKRDSEK